VAHFKARDQKVDKGPHKSGMATSGLSDPERGFRLRSLGTEVWWISEKSHQRNEHKEPDSHYGNHPPERLWFFAFVERLVAHVYFALFDRYEQLPSKIADQQIQN
jgi:hypothetical protein